MGITYLQIGTNPIERHNYVFLFTNLLLIQSIVNGTIKEQLQEDNILKVILCGYVYFIIHMIVTVVLGLDSLRYSNLVLRTNYSVLLIYLMTRQLYKEEVLQALRYIGIIIFIHACLYILQYFGINVFTNDSTLVDLLINRTGIPLAAPFLAILSIVVLRRWELALVFLIPILGGSQRGILMSMLAGIIIVYRKNLKDVKNIMIAFSIAVIILFFYQTFLEQSFNRRGSFVDEITDAFNITRLLDFQSYYSNNATVFDFHYNSTFSFRMSMLLERFLYLFQNPQYLLFGAGSIAEESPYNNFHFFIGTFDETSKMGYCMIDSNDIVWTSWVLRFGLSGLLFWTLLFKVIYNNFKLFIHDPIARAGLVCLFYFIFNAFGSTIAILPDSMLVFFLIIAYSSNLYEDEIALENENIQYT